MRRSLFLLGFLSVSCSTCLAFDAQIADSKALRQLFDAGWEQSLRDDPLQATYLGDHRYDDRLPDLREAAMVRQRSIDLQYLRRAEAFDSSALNEQDQLNLELFAHIYRARVAAQPFKEQIYAVFSSLQGIQTLWDTAEQIAFDDVKDYENWIARLNGVWRYVDQSIALLKTGIREHRTHSRATLARVIEPVSAQAASKFADSAFFAPFKRIPASICEPERQRLAAQGQAAVENVVIPAYQRLNRFLNDEYLPGSRSTAGIWDTADGDAYYRDRVAFHTTTRLEPQQIHELGLREVARIRAEMDQLIARIGFKGSFVEFAQFLRSDPQFYYETPQELFEGYALITRRIDPELVKLFGKLPRTPYGLRAIPELSAPSNTTAYYMEPALDGMRAGYFYVNLYKPQVRPKFEMEVLTAHESVPGHHLQLSLAMELAGLPDFRRKADFTAFVEGWGLYAEGLGEELGLYQDPYSKFAQLTYEMWRAVRLVVDSGIHYKHWTRQQAIDYFKSNAPKTETDIVNEIDRYISWPGQATAYKIGQLKILELRREAQSRLGEKFDIRAFHDVVLGNGSLPLDVLERQVRGWLASQSASRTATK